MRKFRLRLMKTKWKTVALIAMKTKIALLATQEIVKLKMVLPLFQTRPILRISYRKAGHRMHVFFQTASILFHGDCRQNHQICSTKYYQAAQRSYHLMRCIAESGQWVDIDEDGNVYIDGELLEEPYVAEKALGDCNKV